MRDAFGGAFMIKLLIVFIVIYIGFIAIALNYAKAFKVKNKVISYIEENEITNISSMSANDFNKMQEFFDTEILGKDNYMTNISCTTKSGTIEYCQNGIRIVKHSPEGSNKEGEYYTVTTTFGWSIPFLNVLLRLNDQDGNVTFGRWEISGETRTIVNKS